MKLKISPLIILIIVLAACSKDEAVNPDIQENVPVVKMNSTYEVEFKEDIIYAEGQSHESFTSTNNTRIPLKLDVYSPKNGLNNRPVFMFIHGGGFVGGSKQQAQIINIANYYASRGWVFVSIDYRLKNDFGTVPQEWIDYASNLPGVDVGKLLAIYPAQRDAKAAMRWIIANAENYKINTNYITVGGGSAGAVTAIALGISNEDDFRDEISTSEDSTLSTTNMNETYNVKTIVDFWGSKVALDILEVIYNKQRFDSNDPPLFIAHGTDDPTVPFSSAEDLKVIYETNGVPLAFYPFEGVGHGAWNETVNGKRLEDLVLDFVVEQQQLVLE